MAELTDTYVVHGACTQCSMGMRQSRVVLHETHGVFLKKQAQMTVKDCKGEYHVICFGGCYSMENPSTQEEAKKVQDKVKELSPDTFLDKVMGFFTGGKKEKRKGRSCACRRRSPGIRRLYPPHHSPGVGLRAGWSGNGRRPAINGRGKAVLHLWRRN